MFSRNGKRIEQRAVLEHHRDFPSDLPQLRLRQIGDVLMRDDHLPAVRLEETHDVRERYGLADAAASDDRYRLARIDVKVAID